MRSMTRLADLYHHAAVGCLTVDRRGRILEGNFTAARLLRVPHEALVGRDFPQLLADPPWSTLLRRWHQAPADDGVVACDVVLRRADDSHWSALVVVGRGDGEAPAGRGFRVGLVENSRARETQRALVRMNATLGDEVVTDFERAQRELGSDLHDGLGQHLHGLLFLASDLELRLRQRAAPEAVEMKRIVRLLEAGIGQVRAMARGLCPVEAGPEALMSGLRRLARDLRGLHRRDVRFVCRHPVLVGDPLVAGHLFRIAQEAVSNAMKHAQCRRVTVSLTATAEGIRLAVNDDGTGVHRRGSGMGLHVMRYRAELIRGSLVVQSSPGHGTDVLCTVAHHPTRPDRSAAPVALRVGSSDFLRALPRPSA